MRLLHFVSVAFLGLFASYTLYLSRRGLRAARRIAKLETRPAASLEEGPVEVEGVVRAVDRPIRAPSGKASLYLEVEVHAYRGQGKHRQRVHQHTFETKKVDAVLADASGDVRVDLEHVEVVGPAKVLSGAPSALRSSTKEWTKDVPERATSVSITERTVKHGAHVVLSGRAKVVDSKVEMGEGGYRDGAPVEKKTYLVHGTPEEPMIVFEGTERRLLWQASWPTAVLFASGLFALAFAGVVLAVIFA